MGPVERKQHTWLHFQGLLLQLASLVGLLAETCILLFKSTFFAPEGRPFALQALCFMVTTQIRDRNKAITNMEALLQKLSEDPKSGVQFVPDSRWMAIFKETAFQGEHDEG